jgi:hypothetical protein
MGDTQVEKQIERGAAIKRQIKHAIGWYAESEPQIDAETSKVLLLPAPAKIADGAQSVDRCVGAPK